ncbi:hypothetical protein FA743_10975 [Paracoccus gahaiensis]|uniref:Phage terminase small subunit P27 family n=1 Tax=Paracoccus gahaiensis TaxID=1706839 RepID=A0A4U0R8Y6_9RHOB|nr:hypothetical protein [Paracoccus gahaiensis]TJZ91611.1 hypothetical protein FA743_10975 [Paracoccus gahaiensis]
MSRHRNSLAKARLTGADRKNPQRYRDRSEPKLSGRTLGEPSSYLTAEARRAWRIIATELPWLVYEDRALVEMVAIQRGQIIAGKSLSGMALRSYRAGLASLGATPVDRQRVNHRPSDNEDDPFAMFDGPRQ